MILGATEGLSSSMWAQIAARAPRGTDAAVAQRVEQILEADIAALARGAISQAVGTEITNGDDGPRGFTLYA